MSGQPTCEERVAAQCEGRLRRFADLQELAGLYGAATLKEADETGAADAEYVTAACERAGIDIEPDTLMDGVAEAARESLYALPLAVSSRTVFRVDLSTGGPADWLEVVCSSDPTPRTEQRYEAERIVYHFADWFDHAERVLEGDEFATALAFCEQVIPELVA